MGISHSLKVPPTLIWRLVAHTFLVVYVGLILSGVGLGDRAGALSLGSQANRVRSPRLDRRIPMAAGSTLRVENLAGSIRVQAASQSEARVVAGSPGAAYSITTSEASPGVVAITVPPTQAGGLDLEIAAPLTVNLQLKTQNGAIEIAGPVAGVVAESQSGDIILRLPPGHNADLALHSTSGSIRSELPAAIFGAFDSHNLQAKLGQGGPAILLRTMRGNVRLLPWGSSQELAQATTIGAPAATVPVSDRPRSQPVLRTAGGTNADASNPASKPERPPRPLESATVELEAPLVHLNASVSDRSGRAIADLTKSDFAVYEDNIQQVITHFEPATTPFDLTLLLDLSGSTEKKIRVIREAAKRFVDFIGPEDRLAVYTFRRRVQVVSHLTNDRFLLKRRLDEIERGGGGTAFYDALWFTASELEPVSSKRKAIVVMTDGVDNSISSPEDSPSRHTFEELLERLEESDLIVYPIYLDTEYEMVVQQHRETSEAYAVARRQLSELAERTAGVLFRAARVEDLELVYQQVADELRTVYSLAYEPSNAVRDGTWRRIHVKVNRPTAAVRTRRGYYAR